VASAVVAVGLLSLTALGCAGRSDARTPDGAVRSLIAAARTGDRAGVYARLGPATRERIRTLAAGTRRTAGRIELGPEDYLSVGWAPPAWEPSGMRTLRRQADEAEVEVYSGTGDRHSVRLVRETGEWKVELP